MTDATQSIETEIRNRALDYLSGEIALADFEAWLVPATWDLDDRDRGAMGLAHGLQLVLAERSRGHLRDTSFREHIRSIVHHAHLGATGETTSTGSSAATRPVPWRLHQGVAAGTPREEVPA